MCNGVVGYTSDGFKFTRISSYTPKDIQDRSAEIICEDIDILSHPNVILLWFFYKEKYNHFHYPT